MTPANLKLPDLDNDKNFTCTNCGKCCGPVPLSRYDLSRLRTVVKNMAEPYKAYLKSQIRPVWTCMFRDIKRRSCAVYEARPTICRLYGHYPGLVCPHNQHSELRPWDEGAQIVWSIWDELAGILSATIGWKELEATQGE